MYKIIIGLVMIVGGLSGKLVLVGTQSGVALAVLGSVFVVWGSVRLVRAKRVSPSRPYSPPPSDNKAAEP